MRLSPAICLNFVKGIPAAVRCRISYAFRVFAAIYGYRVVQESFGEAQIRFRYGATSSPTECSSPFCIPALYQMVPAREPQQKLLKHRYANEDLYLFHGLDETTGNPDWLGEIFEWLSSSHEVQLKNRDSVGRIPYSEMIFSLSNEFLLASRMQP